MPVHHAEAGVEVADDRVEAEDALLVVAQPVRPHRRGEMALQVLPIAGRQDVGEGVDFRIGAYASPAYEIRSNGHASVSQRETSSRSAASRPA